jgi:hypothetical protein
MNQLLSDEHDRELVKTLTPVLETCVGKVTFVYCKAGRHRAGHFVCGAIAGALGRAEVEEINEAAAAAAAALQHAQ